MMTKQKVKGAPHTWVELNDVVRNADEDTCQKLLDLELRGKARKRFVLRIHSRINRLRADRERKALNKECE